MLVIPTSYRDHAFVFELFSDSPNSVYHTLTKMLALFLLGIYSLLLLLNEIQKEKHSIVYSFIVYFSLEILGRVDLILKFELF